MLTPVRGLSEPGSSRFWQDLGQEQQDSPDNLIHAKQTQWCSYPGFTCLPC